MFSSANHLIYKSLKNVLLYIAALLKYQSVVYSCRERLSLPLCMSECTKRKLADLSPQAESESVRRKMENVSGIDYCEKIQAIMEDVKVKLGTTLTAMELSGDQPTAGEFKYWIGTMVGTLMGGLENQACVVSDMAMEMSVMRERLR